MASYNYATQDIADEHMAKAVGRFLPLSFKFSVETCRWLRGKKLEKARTMLKDVIDFKRAVPLTQHTGDVAHKSSTKGPGRYPINIAKSLLMLLDSVEANAQFKGLNTQSLIISSIVANKGPKQARYGRGRGKVGKATHIEIVVMEAAEKPKKERKSKTEAQK